MINRPHKVFHQTHKQVPHQPHPLSKKKRVAMGVAGVGLIGLGSAQLYSSAKTIKRGGW